MRRGRQMMTEVGLAGDIDVWRRLELFLLLLKWTSPLRIGLNIRYSWNEEHYKFS